MAKLTTARVAEAIKQYNGNLAAVARSQGVVRDTLYRFIKAHPSLRPVIEDARETMIDHAESVLYKKVLAGDTTSLIFFLKTQGKRRGYTERPEPETTDDPLKQFVGILSELRAERRKKTDGQAAPE